MHKLFSLSVIALAIAQFGVQGSVACAFQTQTTKRKPNIVLINLDDCDVDLVNERRLKHFPTLQHLASKSTRFTNCHATTPLCGPSRACLFRCQYAHNTGYRTNRPNLDAGSGFTGGTQFFQDSGLAENQLPLWMKNAGYRTMFLGKYFQGDTNLVPLPGWDRFVVFGGNRFIDRITIYDVYQNGKIGAKVRDGYRTDLETQETLGLLDQYAKVEPEQPFFLYLAPVAPHVGPMRENSIPEKWKDRFPQVELPQSVNFNEDDVSDKPLAYRDILPLSSEGLSDLKDLQRYRMIAMLGIEDMLRSVQEKIAQIGQEQNTIIILTSDHGYLMGQHRILGKAFPLVESTKVPLWVYWPETVSARAADQLLAHIDISATIAELGGATLPEFADGRSFAKLLTDESITNKDAIRDSVLVENWESRLKAASKQKVVYSSIVKPESVYTQWANGEKEFYDLAADPGQLQNGFASLSAAEQSSLQAELHSLRKNTARDTTPTVSISFPTVNRKFVGPEIELSGFVESVTQFEPVGLSIQRKETGQYWNGSSWQKDFAKIATESPPGAGLLSMWQIKPRLADLGAGEVLSIEALVDGDAIPGTDAAVSVRKLEVVFDDQAPTVSIRRPLDQHAYPEFSNFGGLIADDQGSETVQLVIFNRDTKKFFDGEQWTSDQSHAPVFVNPELGRWHANHSLPEGSYEVFAIGKDSAGNWSEADNRIRFAIDQKIKERKPLEEPLR